MTPTERYGELEREIEREAREATEIIEVTATYRKAIALAKVWLDEAEKGDNLLAAINAEDYVGQRNVARLRVVEVLERQREEARGRWYEAKEALENSDPNLFYSNTTEWTRLYHAWDDAREAYNTACDRVQNFKNSGVN